MKKVLAIITVITGLLIFSITCSKRVIPGGPLDVPTPVSNYSVDVQVEDLDALDNTVPAQGISVKLHYPANNGNFETGNTGSNGIAHMTVHSYGLFQVELLPNTWNGYSNSVYDYVTVQASYTEKTIIRYLPIITFATPAATPSWGYAGGTFTQSFTFASATSRYISLSVTSTDATAGVQYYFTPNNYIENLGDVVTFTVVIPKYYQNPNSLLDFTISAADTNNT